MFCQTTTAINTASRLQLIISDSYLLSLLFKLLPDIWYLLENSLVHVDASTITNTNHVQYQIAASNTTSRLLLMNLDLNYKDLLELAFDIPWSIVLFM